jgi:hypothetical protein
MCENAIEMCECNWKCVMNKIIEIGDENKIVDEQR